MELHSNDLYRLLYDEVDTLLDSVWLAKEWDDTGDSHSMEEDSTTKPTTKEDTSQSTKTDDTNKHQRETGSQEKAETPKKQSIYKTDVSHQTKPKINVTPINTPRKRTIQHYRSWESAYKTLKKTTKDRSTLLLDVEKSVDTIAMTDIYELKYKYKMRPTYRLTLLIDRDRGMEIFSELIDQFITMVQHIGVFSSVRLYYLDGNGSIFYDKKMTKTTKASSLTSRDNNLILILSNCFSEAWTSNRVYEHISECSQTNLCTIFQMLPRNMWLLTALQKGVQLNWKSSKKYPLNRELSSRRESLYFEKDEARLKIPVVEFDHFSLNAWAEVIDGNREYAIAGIYLPEAETKVSDKVLTKLGSGALAPPLNQPITIVPNECYKISNSDRLDDFFAQASPDAKRLASYLANLLVSYEIARIIQEVALPHTTISHIAEVFLGGIIKISYIDGVISYDFYDGIKDRLKHNIPPEEALEILDKISNDLSNNFGFSLSSLSWLVNPNSRDTIEWNAQLKKFAEIRVDILKRNGGKYYEEALLLERKIEQEEKDEINFITPTTKSFLMGSNEGRDNEKPIHKVTINYDFEIAQYPVTFEEYDLYCEDQQIKKPNDNLWGRGKCPVINVSWNDAVAYCKWLSEKTEQNYRLPTEAEWEYSCRAGTTTKWSFGDDESKLKEYAWYDDTDRKKTETVGKLKPNPWGLHDMHGNVWEWCQDDWVDSYEKTPRDGKAYRDTSSGRKVLRGGSWYIRADRIRSSVRYWNDPAYGIFFVGFRLLRTLP